MMRFLRNLVLFITVLFFALYLVDIVAEINAELELEAERLARVHQGGEWWDSHADNNRQRSGRQAKSTGQQRGSSLTGVAGDDDGDAEEYPPSDEGRRKQGGLDGYDMEESGETIAYDNELTFKVADKAAAGDASYVRSFMQDPGVDINADIRGEGTMLFRVVSKPETDASVEVTRVLLKHPSINPNGGTTAWSPLKAALHTHNRRLVNALLDHSRTLKQVRADGLDCSVLKSAPNRVTFIVSKGSSSCFKSHPSSLSEDHADVVALADVQEDHSKPKVNYGTKTYKSKNTIKRSTPKPKRVVRSEKKVTHDISESDREQFRQHASKRDGTRSTSEKEVTTQRTTAQGHKMRVSKTSVVRRGATGRYADFARRPIPAPTVVNPEEGFSSFADVALYFTIGRWLPYSTTIATVISLYSVVAASVLFFASGAATRRVDEAARQAREAAEHVHPAAEDLAPPAADAVAADGGNEVVGDDAAQQGPAVADDAQRPTDGGDEHRGDDELRATTAAAPTDAAAAPAASPPATDDAVDDGAAGDGAAAATGEQR